MPDINEEQGKYVFSLAPITVNQHIEGEKKRTFEGTAYGGGRITDHYYWGSNGVVFDLENIEIKTPTPLLEEHFTSSRVGVVKEVSTSQNIQVKGHFLNNQSAQQIIDDSDNEYPFQMSLYIIPGSVEEVGQGQNVTVNGQMFTGPIAVFRHNRIREFTVCSLGADHTTTLNAFTANQQNQSNTQEASDVTELATEKTAREKAEQERDVAINELKQFKATQRTSDIVVSGRTIEIPEKQITDVSLGMVQPDQMIDLKHRNLSEVKFTDEQSVAIDSSKYTLDATFGTVIFNEAVTGVIQWSGVAGEVTRTTMVTDLDKEYSALFKGVDTFTGDKVVLEIWRMQFSPETEFDLINEDFAKYKLTGEALADNSKANDAELSVFGHIERFTLAN